MNVTGVCLVLTVCLSVLAQTVLSVPFVRGDGKHLGASAADHDTIFRERREVAGAAAVEALPASNSDAVTGEASSLMLSRLRRQVAAMAAGGRTYHSHGRRASSGRLAGRQRYHRQRSNRGQVQNW